MSSSPSTRKEPKAKRPSLVSLPDPGRIDEYLDHHASKPAFALVFHTRSHGYSRNTTLAALTAHPIEAGRSGSATIMPGRPLTPEDEITILKALRPSPASAFTVYPDHLLYANDSLTMWWVKSTKAPMAMLSADGQVVQREVVWPSLVMMTIGRRLYVAAIEGNERPDATTDLYFCPTGNVWSSTEVCTGNAVLPSGQGIADIPAWTAMFFDSAFTHDNNHGKSIAKATGKKARTADPMEFWRNASHSQFPADALVPARIQLADWIDYVNSVGSR